MIVTDFTKKTTKKTIRFSALFEIQNHAKQVWFEVPRKNASTAFPYNAFFAAAYPLAIKANENLNFKGPVSKKLYLSVQTINHFLKHPERKIHVKIQGFKQSNIKIKSLGQFFTLGVDSFYTLYASKKLKKTYKKRYLLFVNGYDISLISKAMLKDVNSRVELVAREFGYEGIYMRSNIRSFSDRYIDWIVYHRAALAGAAYCLKNMSLFLFNSSDGLPYNPRTGFERVWTTENMTFDVFGTEENRATKIEKMKKSPLFGLVTNNVRVCWQDINKEQRTYNCGTCEKCIRTYIAFQAAGVSTIPAFPTINLKNSLHKIHIHYNPHNFYAWRQIYTKLTKTSFKKEDVVLIKHFLIENGVLFELPYFISWKLTKVVRKMLRISKKISLRLITLRASLKPWQYA